MDSKYSNDLANEVCGILDDLKRGMLTNVLAAQLIIGFIDQTKDQTRINTLNAAIEAKPKEVGHAYDCPRLMDGVCFCGAAEFNTAIDQWEANLLLLKEGNHE